MSEDPNLPEPMRRLAEAKALIAKQAERERQRLKEQQEKTRDADLASARQDILTGRPAPSPLGVPPPVLSKVELEAKAQAQIEARNRAALLGVDQWEQRRVATEVDRVRQELADSLAPDREAAKRERFDAWQQEQREELRKQHEHDREAQMRRTAEALRLKEHQFEQQYGEEQRAKREQIKTFDQGRRRGVVSRVVTKAQETAANRSAIEERLRDLDETRARMLKPVQQKAEIDERNLNDTQRSQVRELDKVIDRQAERGYEIPAPERGRDLGLSRGPDGPSYD